MSVSTEDTKVAQTLNKLLSDDRFNLKPDLRPKPISRLVFGLMSSQEIRSMSVCNVTETRHTMNSNQEGSLYNLKFGPYDNKEPCATCQQDERHCHGHFGHIELPEPIIHPTFLANVCMLLNLICPYCGECSIINFHLVENVDKGYFRFNNLAKKNTKKMSLCGSCKQSKYQYYVNGYDIYMCDPKKKSGTSTKASPRNIEKILKRVTDETLKKLGFYVDESFASPDPELVGLNPNTIWSFTGKNRPEWVVLDCIPVIPTCDRSPSKINGVTRHDDITDKYVSIVRTCADLRKAKEEGKDWLEHYVKLQEHFATLVDNKGSVSRYQNNNRAHFTIADRVKGKTGYFRGNAQGKRTDFGARSVITAEVNMSFDEIRIPRSIAKEVTVPREVTEENKEYLTSLVKSGDVKIIKIGNRLISSRVIMDKLNNCENEIGLEVGWVVERTMQPGDVVIVNREPTLHRQGMLALKVILGDADSIGMNPATCNGLNSDFDGDEVNIYVLQSEEAQAEAWERMNPVASMISDQTSSLINGPVQDHLTGPMLLTHERVVFTKGQFQQCVAQLLDYNVFEEYLPFVTRIEKFYEYPYRGKTLFSVLFPSNFQYKRNDFEVIDGILVSGVAEKSVIYDIIHQLKKNWGDVYAKNFINNINYLINWYLQVHYMFSAGLDDCLDVYSESGRKAQKEKTASSIRKAEIEVDRIQLDPLYTDYEKEIYTNNALNACMGDEAISSIHPDNALAVSYKSGGKGKLFNLIQMRLFIGQQNIYGVRPEKNTARGRRCNIYCPLDDESPKYRGFVAESYINGMTPLSFIFHSMGAREGLVNTSITTADTGYSQRRMIKRNENNHCEDDGIVRGAGNRLVQPLYGGDGLSSRELIKVKGIEAPQFIDIAKTLAVIRSELVPTIPFDVKVDSTISSASSVPPQASPASSILPQSSSRWGKLEEPVDVDEEEYKKSEIRWRRVKFANAKKQMVRLEELMDRMKPEEIYMSLWREWWGHKETMFQIRKKQKVLSIDRNSRYPVIGDNNIPVLRGSLVYDYRKRAVTSALDKNGNITAISSKRLEWCRENEVTVIL